MHVSATIVEFGAASEKHDAELFEERLEVSGLFDHRDGGPLRALI